VLIADHNGVVRLGFRTLLEREPDIAVVAEVADSGELLVEVGRCAPDVVVLDAQLPGLNRQAIPARVTEAAGVVMVSAADDRVAIARAVGAGVLSYLVHGQFDLCELAGIVRLAAVGQPYLTASASAAVMEFVRRDAGLGPHRGLTAREREVMDLVAQGMSNQDVAEKLAVSIKTVKNHLHRVFRQLKVTDRRSARDVWLGQPMKSSPAPARDQERTGS
jgi:DNA-binding NarL/FixJ family response regulator